MADILVVEDDPAVSMTLALLLELAGHSIRVAANGQEGLLRLHERIPDATISDIEMPVLDGPSMAYRMFIEDSGLDKVPVIIISGFPEIADIASQIGTPYFLSKPFEADRLLGLLARALKEKVSPIPKLTKVVG